MSYSFTVRGATKEEAKAVVRAGFDKVVEQQPIHAQDKAAAIANADAVIELLTDEVPEGCIIGVSCNGYCGWKDVLKEDGSNPLTSVSVSASANWFNPGA